MKRPSLSARVRGFVHLLRQQRSNSAPAILPLHKLEPVADLDGGWRALDADPCFRLDLAGVAPVGLLRFHGSVERYDGCASTQKLIFCADAAEAPAGVFEWCAAGGAGFGIDLYVPFWCRSLHWQPVDAPVVFQITVTGLEYRGLAATLAWLLADRWRLRWHRILPVLHRSVRLRKVSHKILRAFGVPLPVRDYAWLRRHLESELRSARAEIHAHQARMKARPAISLLMVVNEGAGTALDRTLRSVMAQTWKDWNLVLISAEPARRAAAPWLEREPRIRWSDSSLTNAIRTVPGEFMAVLREGDILSSDSLYTIAAALARNPQCELVYSDEDRLDAAGARCDPVFKSGWNPELLESCDYIGALAVFRCARVDACGGWREKFGGAAAYDLALRFTRDLDPDRIHHVPAVLCHRVAPNRPTDADWERSLSALRQRFSEEPEIRVEHGLLLGMHRVRRALPRPVPRVSIIVPSRDGGTHLKTCVGSLFAKTDYADFELLLVDNQSTDPATLGFFAEMAACSDVRVLPYPAPFNYSAINNLAAREASGSVLVLLNDDTEVLTPDWLREMVALACRPEVGAVGAKLYYPDGTIQHGGVGLGIGGVAGHLHLGAAHDADGYLGRLKMVLAVGAVTGACLAVEKKKFDAVGGLDEVNLHVALNDIDLCIKLAERGWRCVWTPYAELVHHESKSRGKDTTAAKQALFRREHAFMRRRWARELEHDPYYHRHLSRTELDLSFCASPRPYRPWRDDEFTQRSIGETS